MGAGYGDGVVPLGDCTYFWDKVTDDNTAAVESRDLAGWRAVFEQRLPAGSALPQAVTSWERLTPVDVRPFWAADQGGPGFALAGDAAGVVHPHSAQGANLALEDALGLGEALGSPSAGSPIPPTSLRRYARTRHLRRRRFVVQSLLAAAFMDGPGRFGRALRAGNFAASRSPAGWRALLQLAYR
jgi:2-polyprenyl-6-methoxyphenol hydroxylase-like FAD-dependent oxidoreductase